LEVGTVILLKSKVIWDVTLYMALAMGKQLPARIGILVLSS
jgi:hypothetical protein